MSPIHTGSGYAPGGTENENLKSRRLEAFLTAASKKLFSMMRTDDWKAYCSRVQSDYKERVGLDKFVFKLGYRRDPKGDTLLHVMARNGFTNQIKLLIDLGAPIFIRNEQREPSDPSVQAPKRQKRENEYNGETPLEILIRKDPTVKFIEKIRDRRISQYFPRDGDHYPRATHSFYDTELRAYPGIYFTQDLDLTFESKNHGSCHVSDSPGQESKLSLHEMMKYLVARTTNSISAKSPKDGKNYVMANMGFITSTAPHEEGSPHRLQFVSIPIALPKYERCSLPGTEHEHTEKRVYKFLAEPEILESLIDQLRQNYNIREGYKIYAIILDLYSTREMCELCEEGAYRFQAGHSPEGFLPQLEDLLVRYHYKLPKEKKYASILSPTQHRLHCVTRVSASFTWFTQNSPSDPYFQSALYPKFQRTPLSIRNIKLFANSVILHRPAAHSFDEQITRPFDEDPYCKELTQNSTLFLNSPNPDKPTFVLRTTNGQ